MRLRDPGSQTLDPFLSPFSYRVNTTNQSSDNKALPRGNVAEMEVGSCLLSWQLSVRSQDQRFPHACPT